MTKKKEKMTKEEVKRKAKEDKETVEFIDSAFEKINELKDAIHSALNCNKPAVINVEIDPNAIYSFRRDSFKHRLKS